MKSPESGPTRAALRVFFSLSLVGSALIVAKARRGQNAYATSVQPPVMRDSRRRTYFDQVLRDFAFISSDTPRAQQGSSPAGPNDHNLVGGSYEPQGFSV